MAERSAPMLVDSHCHLDFPDFAAEREAVIGRAKAAGVETMLVGGHACRSGEKFAASARHANLTRQSGVTPCPTR